MKISELHKTWNSGGPTYLTDNELCILINELVKMREYFRDMGEKIITYYLIQEIHSMQHSAMCRNIPERNYLQ